MKKIVIAMLLMLPLIIVATVLLSTSIISVNVYIAVQKVELNADEMLMLPLSNQEFQFKATVYPTGARNKNVYYEIENYECFGDDVENSVTIDQTGLVKFGTYCAFDVLVTTEEGYKTDRCNVVIESGKVESVTIICDSYEIPRGESFAIAPTFNPIDGQVDNLTWESSDSNILKVDKNGIITGINQGEANVTVFVTDKISATKTFTVTEGVTKFGTAFSSSRNFSLSEIDASGAVSVTSGGVITGDNFEFTDDVAILNIGGKPVTVTKCDNGDIEFEHKEIMLQKLIKLNGMPLYLNAVYSDVFNTNTISVTYVTNNELVATIATDGKITPIGRGEVQFVANALDKATTINMEVIQEIKYIRLNTVDSQDKKGIADTCVYGNMAYENGNFTPYVLELGVLYPQNADWQDFEISVNDESIASVCGNNIVFKENIEGEKKLVITVKAKHSAYKSMDVSARRTMTVTNAVNCTNYESMFAAGQSGYGICMLNNISLKETDQTLKISGSLYGNGNTLDAIEKALASEEPLVTVVADNVTVHNIQIKCDDAIKMNEANGCSGCALMIGEKLQTQRFTNINIEYCIFGDSYFGLALHNSDVRLTGSIIRNTSNFGIFLPTDRNDLLEHKCDYSNLHMHNSVMSNIVATAIGIATQNKLDNGDTLPLQSNFYSTGFLDIYNWQNVTSAKMLDRPIFEDNPEFDTLIKKLLNDVLEKEVKKDIYDNIRYELDGKDYIHLGIVTAGAVYENTSILEIEDERIKKFEIKALDQVANVAKIFKFTFHPCILYIYDKESDIAVETEFYENKWTYRRLRGEESI
ncbi:MAG TPA: Ig-like domain-containing protein [Clostridia bacterium]|nr:Ig-like domain-containing protein [Clostridia bacterium]